MAESTTLRLRDSENGSNHCWINAPLYAILGHAFLLDMHEIHEDFRGERSAAQTTWIELMKQCRQTRTWNRAIYTTVYKELKKHVQQLARKKERAYELVRNGDYGDPRALIMPLFDAITNGYDAFDSPLLYEPFILDNKGRLSDKRRLHYDTSLGLEKKNEMALVSFVMSMNAQSTSDLEKIQRINSDTPVDYFHWIAFVKVDHERYVRWDGLKGKTAYITYQQILDKYGIKEMEEDYGRMCFGFYVGLEYLEKHNPELLNQYGALDFEVVKSGPDEYLNATPFEDADEPTLFEGADDVIADLEARQKKLLSEINEKATLNTNLGQEICEVTTLLNQLRNRHNSDEHQRKKLKKSRRAEMQLYQHERTLARKLITYTHP